MLIRICLCTVIALLVFGCSEDDNPAGPQEPEYDYWVSADTGNDDNSGSESQPWKTITHAVATAGPDMKIRVLPGTYDAALGESFPIVLDEGHLSEASSALFEVFQFNTYRTPSDWKLAQRGKEKLYKEVVASYQEQRPKTYGLEIADQHDFVSTGLADGNLTPFGTTLRACSQHGLHLAFLSLGPPHPERGETLTFCIPGSNGKAFALIMNGLRSEDVLISRSRAAVFTMNGPHFGDRHGIVSELLSAFEEHRIDLLGLSCTIASVTGVVPSSQLDCAVKAITSSFEVPGVVKKA